MTQEYSDAWLIARAEESAKLLSSLPDTLRENLVLASARLPAMYVDTAAKNSSAPLAPTASTDNKLGKS